MAIEKKKQPGRGERSSGASGGGPEERTGKPITVHSYSGFKKDEKPRAFELDGNRLTVLSVKKTWQEESAKGRHRKVFFRVHAHNGRIYDISHDESTDEWMLEPALREGK